MHNKSRAYIVRLVEEQLERSAADLVVQEQYPLLNGLDVNGDRETWLKWHVVRALRLQGVEVVEFCHRPERVVVGFEDEELTLGGIG